MRRSRLQEVVARWTFQRQGPDTGSFTLHRRRLYILPTRFGLAYTAMLLVLLIGGLNYGNNLALAFTFLLAAAGWVAMVQAHANLLGLQGRLEGTCATITGPINYQLALAAPPGRDRIDLELDGPPRPELALPPVVSVAGGQTVQVQWRSPAPALQGAHSRVRRLRLSTRYPLGLFTTWTWIHPPLPQTEFATSRRPQPTAGAEEGEGLASPEGEGDVIGLRAWRTGEPWRRIAWRASARRGQWVVMDRARLAPTVLGVPDPHLRATEPPLGQGQGTHRALDLALLALLAGGALLWGRLPLAISLGLPAAVAWRWTAARRGWPLPPQLLKLLLALTGALAVLATFHTWNGLAAGTALLATMAALKLTETRTPRDFGVLFFLAVFLAFAAVLGDSAPFTALLAFGCLWLALAALLARARPPGARGEIALLPAIGRALLLGLPVATLLFLFVPRIEGRFWALPSDGHAVSGLGDEMRPGDISELSLSDEPAFRVFFSSALPTRAQRYWRGPVLHDFDGTTWRALHDVAYPLPVILPSTANESTSLRYQILLEPTQRLFLPMLERAVDWDMPRARRSWDLSVYAPYPVTTLTAYSVRSDTGATIAGPLPVTLRRRALQWPANTNPRTRAWGAELRSRYADDALLLQAVLQRFSEAPFAYTLTPPRLERNPVDAFLFDTHRGFCGHYASAFVAVARAAGIPARVVTGYLGGDWNRVGGYLLVRQSDAHAWTEVWLEGRGWVRVDPTAAVAPERVESGLDGALGADEPVPGRFYARWPWLGVARTWTDAARTLWQRRFLEFDRAAQERLAAQLGFGAAGLASLVSALVACLAVTSLGLFAWTARHTRWRWPPPVQRQWRRACRRAARAGWPALPQEGPFAYAARVRAATANLPTANLAAELERAAAAYVRWRYFPTEPDS
jgi:transglutaminase-like putative cysteine protease/uncharacterized protein (DUF58 family)